MSEEIKERIRGVIPVVFTPFDEEEKLLEEVLEDHIEFLIKGGVNGLFVCGTYGLGPIMSRRERERVAETAVRVSGGAVPVIVNIGVTRTHEAVRLARHAERIGSDAISCITPYFYTKIDDLALIQHFAIISKSVELPILLYNIPSATGVNITADMLDRILREIPGVIGIKDSSGNMDQLCSHVNKAGDRAIIINGSDTLFLPALTIGAKGVVSAIANIDPQLMIDVYDAFVDGRSEDARRAQTRVVTLRSILREYPQVSSYYEAVGLWGRRFGTVKRPLRPLLKEEKESLRSELSRAGFIKDT